MAYKPNVKIWYHGSSNFLKKPLQPLYLTPSKALAKMFGKAYAFKIKPNAKWLNLDNYEFFAPHIDSFGHAPEAVKRLKKLGYDIVWDSADYKRGQQQIYVLNPKVLNFLGLIKETNIFNSLFEEISEKQRSEIANARPNDVIDVYHGTTLTELANLINGFDTRQVYRRV